MRKLIALLLLCCLLAPVVATFSFLHHRKKQLRREVKHRLMAGVSKGELVLLRFTQDEARQQLRWKHAKEFAYQGAMYDIVSKATRGDTLIFWCWPDNEETQLNRHLDRVLVRVLGNDNQQHEQQQRLVQFLKSLFCNVRLDICWLAVSVSIQPPCFVEHYATVFYPPPFPPPKYLLA